MLPWRSSHRRCSVKKGVLRNAAKCIGKHLCQRLLPPVSGRLLLPMEMEIVKVLIQSKSLNGDEMPVKEYECIGHYQKRVDNWLRKLLILGYKPTFVDVYTQKSNAYIHTTPMPRCPDSSPCKPQNLLQTSYSDCL